MGSACSVIDTAALIRQEKELVAMPGTVCRTAEQDDAQQSQQANQPDGSEARSSAPPRHRHQSKVKLYQSRSNGLPSRREKAAILIARTRHRGHRPGTPAPRSPAPECGLGQGPDASCPSRNQPCTAVATEPSADLPKSAMSLSGNLHRIKRNTGTTRMLSDQDQEFPGRTDEDQQPERHLRVGQARNETSAASWRLRLPRPTAARLS